MISFSVNFKTYYGEKFFFQNNLKIKILILLFIDEYNNAVHFKMNAI